MRPKNIALILLCCILGLCCGCVANSANDNQDQIQVNGKITYNDAPASGAIIYADNIQKTTSDSTGAYSFNYSFTERFRLTISYHGMTILNDTYKTPKNGMALNVNPYLYGPEA